MAQPSYMRACLLIKPGKIQLAEIPVPLPGPGEVLVRIEAALTCGTDVKAFRRGHPMIPMPAVFGHEYAGVVAAVGDGVEGFSVGLEVMGVHSAPCGNCFYCRRRDFQLCESLMDSKVLGSFAEYLLLPERVVRQNLFEKPPMISFAEAAFLEPLACVVHGIRRSGVEGARRVAVIGAGPIGLLHLLVLKAHGMEVLVAGRRKSRLEAALTCGADRVIDTDEGGDLRTAIRNWTDGYGVDMVFECTGQPSVWQDAIWYVRKGGTLVLFGGCAPGSLVSYDAGRLHYDAITILGVFHFTPADVLEARRLLVERKVVPGPLISGEYGLEDVPRALERLLSGDGIKFVIYPGTVQERKELS